MVINLLSNTKTLRKDRWGCAKIRKMKKTRLRPQRVPKKQNTIKIKPGSSVNGEHFALKTGIFSPENIAQELCLINNQE